MSQFGMDTARSLHDHARMTGGRLAAMVLGVFLGMGACGGSTPSGGGSHGGGTAGSAGDGGGGRSAGSGGGGRGSSGCDEKKGRGIDCIDPCTDDFYSPDCVNGHWVCDRSSDCSGPGTCPEGRVFTVEGCLSCIVASGALSEKIEAWRRENAACDSAADCVLTASDTACAGACPVAVSVDGASAFAAVLAESDSNYCSEFAAECGYSTPKCAAPKLECQTGLCQTVVP